MTYIYIYITVVLHDQQYFIVFAVKVVIPIPEHQSGNF